MADKWIGFKHINGKTYVTPVMALLDVVAAGEAVQVLVIGLEAYKVATAMKEMGHDPEMKYVHAHIAGKGRPGRPAKPVVCNETGMVYESINKAASETGTTVGNLSNHLRFPQVFKSVKGHTFTYYTGI